MIRMKLQQQMQILIIGSKGLHKKSIVCLDYFHHLFSLGNTHPYFLDILVMRKFWLRQFPSSILEAIRSSGSGNILSYMNFMLFTTINSFPFLYSWKYKWNGSFMIHCFIEGMISSWIGNMSQIHFNKRAYSPFVLRTLKFHSISSINWTKF